MTATWGAYVKVGESSPPWWIPLCTFLPILAWGLALLANTFWVRKQLRDLPKTQETEALDLKEGLSRRLWLPLLLLALLPPAGFVLMLSGIW